MTDALCIGSTGGPWRHYNCVRKPTAISVAVSDRKFRRPYTGSSDAYAKNWPTASNGSLDMVAYIYVFPRPFEALLESQDITHTPKNTSKPSKSIEFKSLVLSTSFVSISARIALE